MHERIRISRRSSLLKIGGLLAGAVAAGGWDRNTRNAADSIFRNGGSRSLLKLRKSGTGYIGSISMGVQRS